jgi:ferredoxin-NADP reductase
MLETYDAPTSVLAFLTTVHLGLVVLRAHRSAATGTVHLVSGVSILFSMSPWLMASPVGLGIGLLAHSTWFTACERLLGTPVAALASLPAARPPARVPAPAKPASVVEMARRPKPVAEPARRPTSFVATPVVAVFDETPDIRTFRMVRPEGFEFQAGQFLTVRLRADGKEHVRCYSISSPPGSRGHLEITVKRLGMVSGALHASVRPGSMLHVRPPAGAFTYPAGEDRPLVLIAGGVGITPLMSMLRHAIEEEPTRPVTLFYSVRTAEDVAFRDEILMLNRRHTQFNSFIAVAEGPAPSVFYPGRINEALLTAMAPDVHHAICLICGPPPMLDAMTLLLREIGVPGGQVNFEVFQAAIAASAGAPAAAAAAPAASRAGALLEVSFKRSGLTATVGANQKLLDVAESCGADIPSLCRSGVCGTCRTKVLSGNVQCTSRILDDQDRQDGYVLACVSDVLSNCDIDA